MRVDVQDDETLGAVPSATLPSLVVAPWGSRTGCVGWKHSSTERAAFAFSSRPMMAALLPRWTASSADCPACAVSSVTGGCAGGCGRWA